MIKPDLFDSPYNRCPICGSDATKHPTEDAFYTFIDCPACGRIALPTVIYDEKNIPDDLDKLSSYLYYNGKINAPINAHAFFNFIGSRTLFEKNFSQYPYCFHVTKEIVEAWYPKTLNEKIDMFLSGLSAQSHFMGEFIHFKQEQLKNACFVQRSPSHLMQTKQNIEGEQLLYFLDYLQKEELIEHDNYYVRILPKGIDRIDQAKKHSLSNTKNVFIAMSYNDNLKEAEDAIKQAITECGFVPRIMKDIEHNRQIVPEMLYEIRNARFVVVDLTNRNNGAYYEAGYALGCGKEVIQLCSHKDFQNDGHFDVRQINTILWESPGDLLDKLKKRIMATIE